ncbi:flavodoxin [candidate division KSB3 bacterium]|uniref:Flavodoxin n=1 Tax=candidate division KSB3 bacterium TaxID=2044937 RepID=A0A2G6E698_9BACT|nr:MAG: flavodoxin [candidate division KSB3 bacterium]PIE29965.1 MAG: flavodoxin [candidate division KSB3 bacterium]
MAKIGIVYGSTTGNTQGVAKKIQDAFGVESADLWAISDVSADDLGKYQTLLLGSSTWGVGDLQDDWEDGITKLDDLELSGKKVALFGTGDSQGYPDSFVDAIGILYEKVVEKGATVIGNCSTDGYEYDASKAVKDGQFVGLVIDEDNESDLTDERIAKWIEGLKAAM